MGLYVNYSVLKIGDKRKMKDLKKLSLDELLEFYDSADGYHSRNITSLTKWLLNSYLSTCIFRCKKSYYDTYSVKSERGGC